MKNGFSISKGDDLSVNDLLKLHSSGYLVIRSGHLGNHYLSNLLLFSLGIPCYIFDRNLLLKDSNFHPSCILCNNQRINLAKEEEILVPFAKFDEKFKFQNSFVMNSSFSPAKVHLDSMIDLFGENLVWSESEFMFKNAELVEKLVTLIAQFNPKLFQRAVSSQGKTYLNKDSPKDIVREVLTFNEKTFLKLKQAEVNFSSGIIPSVEVTILLATLIGVITTEKNKVFEISGPSMINYALGKSFVKSVNEIYHYLRKEIYDLPETVDLVVVPSFDFRIGSLMSEKDEMDNLWNNLKKIPLLRKEKGVEVNNIPCGDWSPDVNIASRLGIIQAFDEKIAKTLKDIVSNEAIIKRMNFSYRNSTGELNLNNCFFSQYDLLQLNEKLYVPEEILSLSMREVAKYYRIIESAKKQFA